MLYATKVVPVWVAVLGLSACSIPPSPPPEEIGQGMVQALVDTGFYSEVAVLQILGQHHEPARDVWKVVACFQFTLPAGDQGETCIDSFEAYRLDNGIWVVSVTANQVYRWRTIPLTGSAAVAGSDPGPGQ